MLVTVHRAGGNAGRLKQRIEQIGDTAGDLVAQHLGGRLPRVQIVLTNSTGVASLIQSRDLETAGSTSLYGRTVGRATTQWDVHVRRVYAATTLARSGVVIVINAPRHARNLRELDRTLCHELAHAVQLGSPKAREQHIRYLRQQLGIDEHQKSDQRAYEQLMDTREAQAKNLEALARRLSTHTNDH